MQLLSQNLAELTPQIAYTVSKVARAKTKTSRSHRILGLSLMGATADSPETPLRTTLIRER